MFRTSMVSSQRNNHVTHLDAQIAAFPAWIVLMSGIAVALLMLSPSQADASPPFPAGNISPALKSAPKDISRIVEKNEEILQIKKDLQTLLEEGGTNAHESEEFLLKMREFLFLIIKNKLTYLDILQDRLTQTRENRARVEVLTEEEIDSVQEALNEDTEFYQGQQSAIGTFTTWDDAKDIGNEIRTYSQTIAPRLRGLAGLRLVSQVKNLIARAERISDRLETNVEEVLAVEGDDATGEVEAFDFDQAFSELHDSISRAGTSVLTAKSVYLKLIDLDTSAKDNQAMESLRNAHSELKNIRKTSLSITIELIKIKLSQ